MPSPGYKTGPLVIADETGISELDRKSGALNASDDGGVTFYPLGSMGNAMDRLLARSRSVLPAGYASFFHDFDGVTLLPPWSSAGTPAVDATRGPGVWSMPSTNANVFFKNSTLLVANPSVTPWHIGGRFLKTVAPTAGNVVGYACTPFGDGVTNTCHVGIVQALSATKYVFRAVKGGATASALSTVSIDTNFHIVEIWFDGVSMWGSVDNETPVLVTAAANLPTVTSGERFGVETGTGAAVENFFDFAYAAAARTAA
jgi:hypothetical protein